MLNDFFTQRRHADFVGIALKQFNVEFFFQLFDGHRQRRLRHKASVGRLAKVPFAGHRHNVFQLCQGHANVSSFQKLRFSTQPTRDMPFGHVGVLCQEHRRNLTRPI